MQPSFINQHKQGMYTPTHGHSLQHDLPLYFCPHILPSDTNCSMLTIFIDTGASVYKYIYIYIYIVVVI